MMTLSNDPRGEGRSGCDALLAVLPDYLDRTLAPDVADTAAAHLAACATCQALVQDLGAIRAQVAALPVLRPSRDLWPGIAARIDGPAAVRTGSGPAARAAQRRWFGSLPARRVAALAAGLVVATAAVTYTATRWLVQQSPAAASSQVATAANSQPAAVRPTPATAVAPDRQPASAPTPRAGAVTARTPTASFVARTVPTSEYLYDPQIASLRKILEQRRAQLDPKTVAVIERNLRVIDTAIAQSKAALAKDPANGFLVDQLDRDLDTKLELLRTVALLPSHT